MVEGYSSTCNRTHFSSRLLGKVVCLSRTRVGRMRCLMSVCLWIQVCCCIWIQVCCCLWIPGISTHGLLRSFIAEHSKNQYGTCELGYSTKNIPIAKPTENLKCLIDKTDSFLRRVRWKAYHFLNPTKSSKTETFGFPTTKSPPPIKELDKFEEKMSKLIQNIEFKNDQSDFQKQLSRDTAKIKADNKMFIPADKTNNFYRLSTDSYSQLLNTTITKS